MSKPIAIQTAPKDGTVIDVFLNGRAESRIPNVRWGDAFNDPECGREWVDDIGNPVIGPSDTWNKVTHWLPLPSFSVSERGSND